MAELSAADIAKLQTRRTTILDRLNALDGGLGDKPDANQPGSAKHVAYKDGLYRELEQIEKLLTMYDDNVSGADEIVSYGF
ncbi:MAG TPA: hypothetical protein VLA12_00755 [Planctomycetaceae bacterium]|nr:hypothetical protein [Planctomycetaceae bacterium]